MTTASDDTEASDVTCHPGRGMEWTCLGCERVQCTWCDGTDNGSGLCWGCFNETGEDVA